MLVTATTTSQKLQDMFADADLALVQKKIGSGAPDGSYLVFVQNLGGQDVYLELYKDATTTDGVKIPATSGEISFAVRDLQDARFITGSSTSAMRVLISK